MLVRAPRRSVRKPGPLRRAGRQTRDDPALQQQHHHNERDGDQDSGGHPAADRRPEAGRPAKLNDMLGTIIARQNRSWN